MRRFRRLRRRIIAAAQAERSVITATEADGHTSGVGPCGVGCVAPCSVQPVNTSRGQTPLLSLRLGTPGAPMSAALNRAAVVS